MRLDKFTTKFQEALSDAQSIALGNDNAYIEPVHLLVAMLKQDDGVRTRYELCEDLAGHLVEHAQTLYHVQAPSEAEILRRIHAGLCTAESGVSTAEATWIVTRLAELLVWPCPDLVVPPPEQPAAPEVP